ncbi:MAG: arabinofuranosyltransferase, partial [Candidatus Hermodarchaeota archaeon]
MSLEKNSEISIEKEDWKLKFRKLIKHEIVQEFFYASIGNIAIVLMISLFPRFFWDEPYRNIICAIIVLSFFIIFIIFNQPNSKIKIFKIDYKRNIILFTLFNLAILYFLFYRTVFSPNGIAADNFYRSALITQMAYSGYPQDFAFKGFSAFMAPLYWYVLALIAKLFQIESYKMLKIGFLISYLILPILLYEVWQKIFNKKVSFFITALSFTFISNYSQIIWIDHLISFMFFVPFFIYYFENYKEKDFKRNDYIIAGFLGSLLICTFYLYFILVPIYLVVSLIQDKIKNNIANFRLKLKRIFRILLYILIFSSWFWVPLFLNILLIGFESHQNLFFPKYALDMPFDVYFELNLLSILLILGVIFILLKFKSSNILNILGNLVLSVYILYLIGYIGLLIKYPIVHYRVLIVSHYVLVIAFV